MTRLLKIFIWASFSGASGLLAQGADLVVCGKIVDPARASIAGARVRVFGEGKNALISAVTDQNGFFTIRLQSGHYALRASKDNFVEASQAFNVRAGDVDLGEVILRLAPVISSVTVSEDAGYVRDFISSATRTLTPLQDVPQSVTVIAREQIADQMLMNIADVVNYVPGVTAIQGENNRDQLVIRGNITSADFFLNGVRDDVQYYRDLYNLDRVEVLKGPNAMIFGRGGAGGVVNRVVKEAGPGPLHSISLNGGAYGNKRFAIDVNQPLSDKAAFRIDGMYENSGTFRDYVNLERYGINPTVTISAGSNARIMVGYENFRDDRGSDRGIPSFQGKPIHTAASTFFGNPDYNKVRASVNIGTITIEHKLGTVTLRNKTFIGDYDRIYQNFVPGAVTADGTRDSVSVYNNATQRRNIFNQTDVTWQPATGRIRHTLLGGAEVGRQLTTNFRNTGYFNNTDTTVLVPLSNPTIRTPVTFRQSATDADNHLKTNLGAIYVQDQIDFSKYLQLVSGLRLDYFDLSYHDNRSGSNLRRIDHLTSPRVGIVFKPIAPLSLYGSYSISWLPSSGDQFSSLTTTTQQVKPEKISNYEVGAKWAVNRRFALTTALYRLDRTNTRSVDPNDATRIIQTGSQRTNGYEIGISGNLSRNWKVSGGYAWQDAFVSSATASAKAGAHVAQVPHNTFSIWNNYRINRRLGTGIGILNRSDMFAAIDNTVVLPGYTRADVAVYYSMGEKTRLQVNVQNLLDKSYFSNADNNTNISPGSPRAVLIGLVTRF